MRSTFVVQENVPLAEKTTLKIGGAARFFIEAKSENDVAEAARFAAENDLELFVLGGGSNVLISDEGFDGLVLQISLKGISTGAQASPLATSAEALEVTAQAGEDWDEFVAFCIAKNLAGLECLSGIPGFVGGTPVQNVGAYGQEVSETLASVRVFDRKTNAFSDLPNRLCGFSYRQSIFNTIEKNRYIVLAATYALKPNAEPKIVYTDLIKHFNGKQPNLRETREAVIGIRAAKSMVIAPGDPNRRSVGSFFKNPIVSNEKFAEIAEREEAPAFKVDENSVKIPAAWLIENSGFYKGFRRGNAGLSTKHTLAIVNLGGATAKEILALKEEIQTGVKRRFDILLETEPVFIGFGQK
jgi:UDP-N-acetylmuramate dehydrogenase